LTHGEEDKMELDQIKEKMSAGEAKGALIEKVTFAVLPIMFTCVVYLMNALSNVNHQLTILESKMQLVVTSDNKQAPNMGAELAREKLRQDFMQANTEALSRSSSNKAVLDTLVWRVQELEKHKEKQSNNSGKK
jgi:cell division protein FtsX